MGFGETLKKIRGEKNLSQHALAKKLSVAQSTIGMWEAGRRTPKLAEINRLAMALNITVSRLISGRPEKRVEVVRNEIYVDGAKVSELDASDIDGILKYIDDVKKKKAAVPLTPAAPPGANAKKILVIDDEQEICEMLYTFLVPHNYKVFLAFSGQMGLEYFEEIRPDIVLLDLKMSDIDGIEVLRIIRKVSSVPVVIITAHSQDVADIHLADLKIDGYLEKPVSLQAVLNTLKFLIGE